MESTESAKRPQRTIDLLAQRREVLARQFDAESEVAKHRAELARVEAELIKAGFDESGDSALIW